MSDVKILCINYNGEMVKSQIPETWLKKSPNRPWQYSLPDNVYPIRIAESLHGYDITELPEISSNLVKNIFDNYHT